MAMLTLMATFRSALRVTWRLKLQTSANVWAFLACYVYRLSRIFLFNCTAHLITYSSNVTIQKRFYFTICRVLTFSTLSFVAEYCILLQQFSCRPVYIGSLISCFDCMKLLLCCCCLCIRAYSPAKDTVWPGHCTSSITKVVLFRF